MTNYTLLELVTALRREGYNEAANRIVDGELPLDAMEHLIGGIPLNDDDEGWTLQDFIDKLALGETGIQGLV